MAVKELFQLLAHELEPEHEHIRQERGRRRFAVSGKLELMVEISDITEQVEADSIEIIRDVLLTHNVLPNVEAQSWFRSTSSVFFLGSQDFTVIALPRWNSTSYS